MVAYLVVMADPQTGEETIVRVEAENDRFYALMLAIDAKRWADPGLARYEFQESIPV